MPTREFDLNIERVLENWTVAHAIRELIANALDEAALTGTAEQHKHGFGDITTLHAVITAPSDTDLVGTDVELSGVADDDVEAAKALFRHYAGDEVLEETEYGVVLKRPKWAARIYVNGLRVAEERNYVFSYDITSPTKALRAALNRERSNVGRTAYTDRVKAIVLAATSAGVASAAAEDLSKFETGRWHGERQLVDVGVHACQVLNASGRVIFLTPQELNAARDFVDRARNDGYR